MLQFALTLLVGMGVQGQAEKPPGWDDPWAAEAGGEEGETAPPEATLPRTAPQTEAATEGETDPAPEKTGSSTTSARRAKAKVKARARAKAVAAAKARAASAAAKKAPVAVDGVVITAKVASEPQPAKKTPIRKHRKRSSDGNAIIGWLVPDDHLRVAPLVRPSGNLHLYVLATKEQVK